MRMMNTPSKRARTVDNTPEQHRKQPPKVTPVRTPVPVRPMNNEAPVAVNRFPPPLMPPPVMHRVPPPMMNNVPPFPNGMGTFNPQVNVQATHLLYQRFSHLFVNQPGNNQAGTNRSRTVCDGSNLCEEMQKRRMRGGRGRWKHSSYCNGGPCFAAGTDMHRYVLG